MEIPWQTLSEDALRSLVEEFVSREGTDYGPGSYSLQDKVDQVLGQLKTKRARIVYDAKTQTCNIESIR